MAMIMSVVRLTIFVNDWMNRRNNPLNLSAIASCRLSIELTKLFHEFSSIRFLYADEFN